MQDVGNERKEGIRMALSLFFGQLVGTISRENSQEEKSDLGKK